MQPSPQDAEHLVRYGIDAFRSGRLADARGQFEQAAAGGATSGVLWMLLAVTRRADNDFEGEEEALNRLIEIEPDSVRGHVMKGDCRASAGDDRAATYFYERALHLAKGKQLPPEVATDVARAEQVLAQIKERGHAQREAKLKARGLTPDRWSPRLRRSLEIAAGRRKLYRQQPTAFNYVELPDVQYFDPAQFDWAAAIEAATSGIRDELQAVLARRGDADFRAYIQGTKERIDTNKGLLDNKDWSALFLCESGLQSTEMIAACPRTWEAIQRAPLPSIPSWGPTVMFSLLKAGARIQAHTGMFNTRLVCHLPLIVPPNCRFRVGNEVREWEAGKLLIFDDTIEHEAWNDSGEDRVILIFDIWRPELSEQERRELEILFSA